MRTRRVWTQQTCTEPHVSCRRTFAEQRFVASSANCEALARRASRQQIACQSSHWEWQNARANTGGAGPAFRPTSVQSASSGETVITDFVQTLNTTWQRQGKLVKVLMLRRNGSFKHPSLNACLYSKKKRSTCERKCPPCVERSMHTTPIK